MSRPTTPPSLQQMTHLEKGVAAEQKACEYLQDQGLRLKTRNFSCRFGEIDLIMWDKEYLVFVEVRYRRGEDFGGSLASVGRHKQRKLIKTATYYLIQERLYAKMPCRFDVVALGSDEQAITWIKHAFQTQL